MVKNVEVILHFNSEENIFYVQIEKPLFICFLISESEFLVNCHWYHQFLEVATDCVQIKNPYLLFFFFS